jgi:hypothetical protein
LKNFCCLIFFFGSDEPPPQYLEAAVAAGQNLKGHKLLRAQVHLIKLLRRIRDKIKESEGQAPQKDAYAPGSAVHVDTALLKALVRAEPENVLAFLQRPNRCDLEVGIKLLTEYEMLHELMELFKSCHEHRRALELLQVCARSQPSSR